MSIKQLIRTASWMALVAALLAACLPGRAQTAATPTPDTFASAVAQTLTAMPSETAQPSSTPAPTTTATVTATPTTAPSPTPSAYGPSNFPDNINPLTGLPVADASILNRRPVMIKVANFPREGRPHAGLSNADIVFDYWIGHGANRFLAVFYGQDAEQVGPIRSARLVDAQLGPLYQGILGFESGYITITNKVFNALGNRAVSGSPSTCPAICDDGRGTVTSIFANTAKFNDLADRLGINNDRPNLDGMVFDATAPDGEDGASLLVQFNFYNRAEWRYDEASGRYLRWIEDVDAANNVSMIPLVDRNSNQQLAFDNVVVLFAYYTEYAPSMHDVELQGQTAGRRAVLFRDGKAIEAIWKAPNSQGPLQFFTPDGQPLPFKPGNSWMVLTGLASGLGQSEPGAWKMTFALP